MIFLVILLVFMVSHGVSALSVLVPQKVSIRTVRDVIIYPYMTALGNIDFTFHQTDRK